MGITSVHPLSYPPSTYNHKKMDKYKMEQQKRIEKLLTEYEMKLDAARKARRILLIDFTREYNQIWGKL